MLTVIETNDGRLLITDKKNIKQVIQEARKDYVDLGNFEDIQEEMKQSRGKYILISGGEPKAEGSCSVELL